MIPLNLLLAFQLENYKNLRFLKFSYSRPKFWVSGSKRQQLDYTSKAKILLFLSLFLCVLDVAIIIYLFSGYLLIGSLILAFMCFPIYFVVANILLSPVDSYLKNKIIKKAKNKIQKFQKLKVIAITWSYGKTTTKEMLQTILKEKYNVLATEGTKNTPLWISRLILNELNNTHDIFIVEMGAYEKWDIKELCDIVYPEISLLTGITLQHLERFKCLDNIIDAKFEILEALGEGWLAIVDSSTEWVQKGLKNKKLTVKNIIEVKKWFPYSYKEWLAWIEFELDSELISTKILSNYVVETLQLCYHVTKHLGMNISQFNAWVKKIDFVEHRMQLIHNPQSNVYVIDDSFNGNLEWIASILHLMEHAPFSGRKIMVAGGVVELWDKTIRVHEKLWKDIAKVADIVLLIDGKIGNTLESSLLESGFKTENIKKYPSALSLHKDLKNIISSGDMVIFQNDLPDNYL